MVCLITDLLKVYNIFSITNSESLRPFIMQNVVPYEINSNKKLSYRRETALQGVLVVAKSGRMELVDDILRTLYLYLQPL